MNTNDTDETKLLDIAYNSFRIIGIKAVLPQWGEFPENAPRRSDKVEAIQKAL